MKRVVKTGIKKGYTIPVRSEYSDRIITEISMQELRRENENTL